MKTMSLKAAKIQATLKSHSKASHCVFKSTKVSPEQIKKLLNWFSQQKRPLPWRKDRNPYKIWISEIMLQQTTTTAVIPYFERFIKRFPNVTALAQADLESVYEMWAGLGYYSRARNIHKSAQIIHQTGFKTSYKDLLKLPGVGPYASRAISSQAFAEPVGVVDGNVIRVFSRVHDFKDPWWPKSIQNEIQSWSDHLAQTENPSDINQALMELGATVCTPKSPACFVCPWTAFCKAFKHQTQTETPIKKPKTKSEIWIWEPEIFLDSKNRILLTTNPLSKDTPLFLKNKWVFPGKAMKVKTKPKTFTYKHSITHHEIYVCLKPNNKALKPKAGPQDQYVDLDEIQKISPFSLVRKAIKHIIN